MVGRPGKFQPRFTSGELDPLVQSNTDLKTYSTGAARMVNVEPLPQGGFTVRPGLRRIAAVRGTLMEFMLGAYMASAPAGGTVASAFDGNASSFVTTNALTGETLVFALDFGAEAWVTAFDLELFGAARPGDPVPSTTPPNYNANPALGTLRMETSLDGSLWEPIGTTQAVRNVLRTRRFAVNVNETRRVRLVRLIVSLTPANATFSFSGLRAWAETSNLSPVRIRSFARSSTQAYDLVLTDQNAEVLSAAGRVASIPLPHEGALLPAIKHVQKLDTAILFHNNVEPKRIMLQGSDTEWNIEPAPFRNVPNYDFGLAYTNGTPAVWIIEFFNFESGTAANPLPSGGASFILSVNGQDTPSIQVDPSYILYPSPTFVTILQDAINVLPGLRPGVTVAQDATSYRKFTVTFSGTGNEGDGWAVSGKAVNKADAAVTASHKTVGVIGGEPIMSAARGWPACGTFFQQRLIIGGFKSVENAALASQEGDVFQLDTRLVAATAPLLLPLNTDGAERIVHMHQGRTLVFFTTDKEYWLQGSLTRTVTPVVIKASANGIALDVPPVESESATIYLHNSRGSLFEFKYDFNEQNYLSANMSVSSSSLVENVVDLDIRKITSETDVNQAFGIKGDGTGFIVALLRSQEVTAFARTVTDGALLAVCVNGRADVTFATERFVNGMPRRFIERMDNSLLLDQAEVFSFPSPVLVVTGLEQLEGRIVWAQVDGWVQGPFVVLDHQITLEFEGSQIVVGRWTPPLVRTLPLPRDIAPKTVMRRPARIHTVRVQVVDTTSIALRANDGRTYEADLMRFGMAADVPPLTAPFTGEVVFEGLQGFSDEAAIEITQKRPGLLTVTGVTIEADL